MARKSRRRQQNRPRPRPQTGQPAAQPGAQTQPQPAAAPAPEQRSAAAAAREGGGSALVRAMEMTLPAQAAPRRGRGTTGIVLESGDAAIPLDRVPYFTGDLKRLGVTAVVMLAILVTAAIVVIPQVVK